MAIDARQEPLHDLEGTACEWSGLRVRRCLAQGSLETHPTP